MQLTFGQSLRLGVQAGDDVKWFTTRILSSSDDAFLVLSPRPGEGVNAPEPGTRMFLQLVQEHNLLEFPTRFLAEQQSSHGRPSWSISNPDKERGTRMAFNPRTKIRCVATVEPFGPGVKEKQPYQADMMDISPGGTKIITPAQLPVGQRVMMSFQLDEKLGKVTVRAKVVRIAGQEEDGRTAYGMLFLDPPRKLLESVAVYQCQKYMLNGHMRR